MNVEKKTTQEKIAKGALTDYQQAPPLLASPWARLFHCLSYLFLRLVDICLDLFTTLVNDLNHGFLLLHKLLHLVEEVRKFDNGLFNTLNFVVSSLDLTKSWAGLATTVSNSLQDMLVFRDKVWI